MTRDSADSVDQLLAKYISLWNERDLQARRAIVAEIFVPHGRYVDPNASAEGTAAIDTYVETWQQQFPDMVFHLGEVRDHHNLAHFDWSFGPPGELPVANGWDVVVLEDDRISKVYGFFN